MKYFLFLFLLTTLLPAQNPIPDALTTAGTTRLDPQGRRWGFVALNAVNPTSLSRRTLAVFIKPAAPDAAGSFTRVAVLAPVRDGVTVKPLLERAEALGESLTGLDVVTQELWAFTRWNDAKALAPNTPAPVRPYPDIPPLAERLAGLVLRGRTDPEIAQSLQLMAFARPSIRQLLGQGWAGLLPVPEGGKATVEIRDWNAAAQNSISVLGRVILDASDPLPLPPPEAPWVLPDESAKAELNIKLRWATPVELARRSLTQAGFNLWRLPRAAGAAPFPAQPGLEELILAGAVRVNKASAILTKKAFTSSLPPATTDVTNLAADPDTFFFADDNDRFSGGTAFRDGEQFYYYTTARDLLGRDGMVSAGTLATACRRVPPPAPQGLLVENDYTYNDTAPAAARQGFRISWKPLAPDTTQATADGALTQLVYEVVKGDDLDKLNDPRLRAGLTKIDFSAPSQVFYPQAFATEVPDAPGTDAITLTDYSDNPLAANFRDTFFFAVRAVRVLRINGVLACRTAGPWCAPIMAALHDRVGPARPVADLLTVCARALVKTEGLDTASSDQPIPPGEMHFRASCRRLDGSVEWAEFRYEFQDSNSGQIFMGLLGRHYFGEGADEVSEDFTSPVTPGHGGTQKIWCRTGGYIGTVSREAISNRDSQPDGARINVIRFAAGELSPLNFDPAHFLASELSTEGTARTLSAVQPEKLDDAYFSAQTGFAVGSEVLIQVDQGGGVWRFAGVDFVSAITPIVRNVRFIDGVRGAPVFLARPLRAWQMRAPDTAGGEVCIPINTPSAPSADDPGGSGPLVIFGKLADKAREYRIYRQVADGPLTMIKQGTDDPPTKDNFDPAAPNKVTFDPAARLPKFAMADGLRIPSCVPRTYYLQVFDKDGNQSPMSILWQDLCLGVILPTPRLSDPKPGGTDAAPTMIVEWFCEPDGVERFEIAITSTTQTGIVLPGLTAGLTNFKGTVQTNSGGKKLKLVFKDTQVTPAVGGPLFNETSVPLSRNGPRFRAEFPVSAGTNYRLSVRAVNAMKNRGAFSGSREFSWNPPPDLNDPAIPWPVRPLPPVKSFPVGTSAPNGVQAMLLPPAVLNGAVGPTYVWRGGENGSIQGDEILAGVRIGSQTLGGEDITSGPLGPEFMPPASSPAFGRATFAGLLYGQPGEEPGRLELSLPAVLYREQVPNVLFPDVSGDLMQVSPMITGTRDAVISHGNLTGRRLLDPYLAVRWKAGTGAADIFLVDTQPAISGASYRYHLLRFDALSLEPVQTVPCGEVTIP